MAQALRRYTSFPRSFINSSGTARMRFAMAEISFAITLTAYGEFDVRSNPIILPVSPRYGALYRRSAYHVSLGKVGLGGDMRCTALEYVQLDCSGLATELNFL